MNAAGNNLPAGVNVNENNPAPNAGDEGVYNGGVVADPPANNDNPGDDDDEERDEERVDLYNNLLTVTVFFRTMLTRTVKRTRKSKTQHGECLFSTSPILILLYQFTSSNLYLYQFTSSNLYVFIFGPYTNL
jgi:hypothetical protein